MKSSPLKRKTPLRQKTKLLQKTSIKFAKNSSSDGTIKSATKLNEKTKAKKKGYRRYGLQGIGRSTEHKQFHQLVVELGCMACRILGTNPNGRLTIHHSAGRRKGKGDICEWLVICLCYVHHDPTTTSFGKVVGPSVHGNKKLFVELVGSEPWCIYEIYKLLHINPPWLNKTDWASYIQLDNKISENEWIVAYKKNGGRYKMHTDYLINSRQPYSIDR